MANYIIPCQQLVYKVVIARAGTVPDGGAQLTRCTWLRLVVNHFQTLKRHKIPGIKLEGRRQKGSAELMERCHRGN
ncbi:hypothetical protein ACLK19_17070 [Escherichia coli]